MFVAGGDHVLLVAYAGFVDYESMFLIAHGLRIADLFVDVGANIGLYTILPAGVAGARTVAYEPLPSNALRLGENLALNGIADRVTVRQAAVAAAPGRLTMSCPAAATSSVVPNGAKAADQSLLVDAVRLDDEPALAQPTLLKIDVEGYEGAVLQGADRMPEADSLLGIIIELTGHGSRYGYSDSEIHEDLVRRGFRGCSYDPFKRSLLAAAPSSERENCIYLRDAGTLRERVAEAPMVSVPHCSKYILS